MRNRQRRSVSRVIRITEEANDYLNHRAQELDMSGADYSRQLMFLECWDGLVFDDVRAIYAAAELQGKPIEQALPVMKMAIERLRRGEEEVDRLKKFVLECILPALDRSKEHITAARRQEEEGIRNLVGTKDMVDHLRKSLGEGPA